MFPQTALLNAGAVRKTARTKDDQATSGMLTGFKLEDV